MARWSGKKMVHTTSSPVPPPPGIPLMATEMIKGKSIEDALALTNKEVVDALGGLPAHKLHCSVLAEEAVKSAVKDYYDKNGIAYDKSKFPACEDCESCRMV